MERRRAQPGAPTFVGDPALIRTLHRLRRTDNVHNLLYVARAWLFLAAVLGGTVWWHVARSAAGWPWWWDVPVAVLAVVLVGAGQHQLAGLGHEGSHHTLFRDRRWNELASDWLCMFPLFSTTYFYRLQHLPHHRFTNDPERDPDIAQLEDSGHRLRFPVPRRELLRTFARWLRPGSLARFTLARAVRSSTGGGASPYRPRDGGPAALPLRLAALSPLLQGALLAGLLAVGDPVLLLALPLALWAASYATLARLPDSAFEVSRLRPVIPVRSTLQARNALLHGVLLGLAWITHWTGVHALALFVMLWIAPMMTSFGFFMMLRQVVQHGNADGGALTNTRTFVMPAWVRFAVFPIGQDQHLAHHLFPSIPHHALPRLHEALLEYPEYRERGVVVRGYFRSGRRESQGPTAIDVLTAPAAGGQP